MIAENATEAKINDIDKGNRTCSDIIFISMMVKRKDTNHRDNNDKKTETNRIILDKEK